MRRGYRVLAAVAPLLGVALLASVSACTSASGSTHGDASVIVAVGAENEYANVIGQVGGKNVIIVDDMIDTAGTLVHTAQALHKKKAKSILACATHAVLSGPALERLKKAPLDELILTNTVPLNQSNSLPKLTLLSVASLLAKAIRSIHDETSVSNLFV